jgi:hypothetical protein
MLDIGRRWRRTDLPETVYAGGDKGKKLLAAILHAAMLRHCTKMLKPKLDVVPAKAGTHNHRVRVLQRPLPPFRHDGMEAMDPRLRGDDN